MNTLDQSLGYCARVTPTSQRCAPNLDCRTGQSLREITRAEGQPAQVIDRMLGRLENSPLKVADWKNAAPPELIAHILESFHQRHRQQLPELIHLAREVERTHGEHPACPHGLADYLGILQRELENHMQVEEQVLFPLLAHGNGASARTLILAMCLEDRHYGESLQRLNALTGDFTLPPAVCNTWRALYLELAALCVDLMEHVYLENNILFKTATQIQKRGVSHG